MNKDIENLKRRAGILNEDVVPFKPRVQPEPQAEPDTSAAKEKRVQAMAQLSEALAEELWDVKQDKEAVKAHLKDVVNNLVMSVMYRFSEED